MASNPSFATPDEEYGFGCHNVCCGVGRNWGVQVVLWQLWSFGRRREERTVWSTCTKLSGGGVVPSVSLGMAGWCKGHVRFAVAYQYNVIYYKSKTTVGKVRSIPFRNLSEQIAAILRLPMLVLHNPAILRIRMVADEALDVLAIEGKIWEKRSIQDVIQSENTISILALIAQ